MKKAWQIIFLLFLPFSLYARCGPGMLTVWPTEPTLSQHPLLVIEGYADQQSLLQELKSNSQAFLMAGDHRVALRLVELLVGQFQLTQAIVSPAKTLLAGKVYQLIIERKTGSSRFPLYQNIPVLKESHGMSPERAQWTVVAQEDRQAPEWLSLPREVNKTLVEHECGPASFVNFHIAIADESPVLVRTIVRNEDTGQITSFLMPVQENLLKVGHGMCAGAFLLSGQDYQVTFNLVDAAGNETAWNQEAIHFTKPVMLTQKE